MYWVANMVQINILFHFVNKEQLLCENTEIKTDKN